MQQDVGTAVRKGSQRMGTFDLAQDTSSFSEKEFKNCLELGAEEDRSLVHAIDADRKNQTIIHRVADPDIPGTVGLIDLKATFGQKYRVGKDPAAGKARRVNAMYHTIRCRYGEIYSAGGNSLEVLVTSRRIAEKMKLDPVLEVTQDADDATIFRFDVCRFNKVAQFVKPRRRRQTAAEHMRKIGSNTAYRSQNESATQRSRAGA